ncbi:MAG: carbohydrate kinase family protein [Parcubacteria group bacterium]|nr:carbohydrate kinase family protein [Parcubacteria group bacterium]
MSIIVTGSVAYNHILNFPGRFSTRLHLDDVHVLNAFFYLDQSLTMLGGSAGNIAYTLKLFGEEPHVIAAVGRDFERYRHRFESLQISTRQIQEFKDEATASATIIVDRDDNQIIAFLPGAARHCIELDVPNGSQSRDALLIIIAAAPPQVIVKRCTEAVRLGIPYIFAPGSAIGGLTKTELRDGYRSSLVSMFNDYEWKEFQERARKDLPAMLQHGITVAITRGEAGSMIYTKDQEYFIPIARRDKVISPFGAGDAYLAGLALGVARAWNWQDAGQVASVAASFAVETFGPQEHMFTLDAFNRRYHASYQQKSPLET